MRKVFSTGIVLSALLAWSALSVGQNTAPAQLAQAAPAAAGQTAAAPVAAGVESGTVVAGGVMGTGLAATEAIVLGVVAAGTIAAVANTDNTEAQATPATGTR